MNALTDEEVAFLKFIRLLTEESRDTYATLLYQYIFKFKNSERFRAQCERQEKSGFNSFAIWMGKNNFEPQFKEGLKLL